MWAVLALRQPRPGIYNNNDNYILQLPPTSACRLLYMETQLVNSFEETSDATQTTMKKNYIIRKMRSFIKIHHGTNIYCEAQGKGRAKGRPRKVTQRSFIDGGWWMVDILSLMLYIKFG